MIEDELIKIWQSSPNQERIKFEKSRLMIDVQSSMDRLHRGIKYRDLGEQIGIAIVIPAFAYCAYALPSILSKVASVLIIVCAIYIGVRLKNAKKHKPSPYTETYLEYLNQMRAYINIQKQMMDNVIYWYIIPCATLTMLFVMGFGIVGRSRTIINWLVINIGLAIASYFGNKQAVKKQFIPRLEKIDELIKVMEKA